VAIGTTPFFTPGECRVKGQRIARGASCLIQLRDACGTPQRPGRTNVLQFLGIDEGLVNPSATVMSPPNAAPNDRPIDSASRNNQVPNVPDASPCGTEAGIKMIFKIVQHKMTLVKSGGQMKRSRRMWSRLLIARVS
jgi:hypothetical protein